MLKYAELITEIIYNRNYICDFYTRRLMHFIVKWSVGKCLQPVHINTSQFLILLHVAFGKKKPKHISMHMFSLPA